MRNSLNIFGGVFGHLQYITLLRRYKNSGRHPNMTLRPLLKIMVTASFLKNNEDGNSKVGPHDPLSFNKNTHSVINIGK